MIINKIKNNSFIQKIYCRPIYNYFKTNFKKTALFSYSVFHFKTKNSIYHSCNQESLQIVNILKNFNYNVDICNENLLYKNSFKKYSLVFGEGLPVFQSLGKVPLTIYYGTGSHPWHQTFASLKRLEDVYKDKRVLLCNSIRTRPNEVGLAANLSDFVFCIGNKQTKKTYKKFRRGPIFSINPSYINPLNKQMHLLKYNNAKKNFLFFGSYGHLHKGLDLLLQAFSTNSDLNLHVCVKNVCDTKFFSVFKVSKNVKIYGFINISSDHFQEICKTCAWVILPSVSEGAATSVITCMAYGGLLPILTKECGIDARQFGGIEIKSINLRGIHEALQKTKEKNPTASSHLACMQRAKTHYSLKKFQKKIKQLLLRVLKK